VPLHDSLASTQLLAGWPRLADLRFLNQLYGKQLIFPKRFRLLHVLRTWFVARHFEVKFSLLAIACSSVNLTVYYNGPMLGLIAAFRRRNKLAWDVQHGFIGQSHEAYNNASAFAIPTSFRPSGFIVWDEHFGQYVESMLGAPWQSTDYIHIKKFVDLGLPCRTESPRVLFTLQWGTLVPQSVIIAATLSVGVDWVFRMHPVDSSKRPDLKELREAPNVQIVDCSDYLPSIIASSFVHVTVNSSVVHEAAALGVPSIFFDPICFDRFEREMAQGLAQFADDTNFASKLQMILAKVIR
jgi:hypothetical protein